MSVKNFILMSIFLGATCQILGHQTEAGNNFSNWLVESVKQGKSKSIFTSLWNFVHLSNWKKKVTDPNFNGSYDILSLGIGRTGIHELNFIINRSPSSENIVIESSFDKWFRHDTVHEYGLLKKLRNSKDGEPVQIDSKTTCEKVKGGGVECTTILRFFEFAKKIKN